MNKQIRWKQRYENLASAYKELASAVKLERYSSLERSGLIQTFEVTFELAWKTLKDFLESEGYQVVSPKDVIKQAFQSGYIESGDVWLDALEGRNLLSHTYNKEFSEQAVALIKQKYFPIISNLILFFENQNV